MAIVKVQVPRNGYERRGLQHSSVNIMQRHHAPHPTWGLVREQQTGVNKASFLDNPTAKLGLLS